MSLHFEFIMGGEFGGIGASLFHGKYYSCLMEIFREHMQGNYLINIKEFYIALRVSGDVVDYKGDGPERLRYMKKQGYISIDFVIPECKWNQVPCEAIKENFCKGIYECFYLMVERAEKANEFLDKQGMINDFEKSMKIFQDKV